jgi:small-conductance mechanosensitive channel
MSSGVPKSVSAKNKFVYILGVVLLWLACYINASFLWNGFGSVVNNEESDIQLLKFFVFAIPGLILIIKGLGYWFTDQGFWERVRIWIAIVPIAAIVCYFLAGIAFFFPVISIVFIIMIIKSRKW